MKKRSHLFVSTSTKAKVRAFLLKYATCSNEVGKIFTLVHVSHLGNQHESSTYQREQEIVSPILSLIEV